MRHAYLIIAHNEFEILQTLINALDDEHNDIFVHIDKKVKRMPDIHSLKSQMHILDNRIDVRWGHYSQIETEMQLFEASIHNGPYAYYHLISGSHLPLCKQDEIHTFFSEMKGKNIFSNLTKTNRHYQEILKVHRINLFLRNYSSPAKMRAVISQWLWKAFIAIQRQFNISINDDTEFYWANNWCSLTEDAVNFIVSHKNDIKRRYKRSFCGDEFFVPTELMRSELADTVVSSPKLLYGTIGRSNASVLTMDDYESLIHSGCLFGRKFSISERKLIERVKDLFDETVH